MYIYIYPSIDICTYIIVHIETYFATLSPFRVLCFSSDASISCHSVFSYVSLQGCCIIIIFCYCFIFHRSGIDKKVRVETKRKKRNNTVRGCDPYYGFRSLAFLGWKRRGCVWLLSHLSFSHLLVSSESFFFSLSFFNFTLLFS